MNGAGRQVAVTLGAIVGAGALAFGVAAPPERCPALTVDLVEGAVDDTAGWIIRNQQADGTWLYEYDRARDVAVDDYNVVRHAGVMSALYQSAARGVDGALGSADRGLAWALDHVVERHGWAGVTTSSTVQAGTNALLVSALVERRLLTGDDEYDDLLARLGRFLTSQVESTGAVLAYYDLGPDEPRAATHSIYYTGEAYWALGRLHRLDPDAGWGAAADRVGHYMATVRDDVEDIWPPLADHWSGYGLAETAAFPERRPGTPLTDAELEFVRRQGGLIGQRVRSISQRFGPWGVAVRGTFTPRGGGYGVFGEGLAGLWRASQLDERLAPEREALGERALCIVGLAIEAQAGPEDAAEYPDPGKVEGAWFIDDVTRMDDQQHALSALLFSVPILEAAAGDGGHSAPSWWLWLIVVIGTLNPPRSARGMPGRDRRARLRLAAVGGAVGVAVLVGVGATSGWLLDSVDVSRPAMRLAAASLCLLTAAIDLARSPSAPPLAAGESIGAMFTAVTSVVRPALVFAGLAVVADHSLGFDAFALIIAVASTVVATTALDRGDEVGVVTAATWTSRLFSSAAVVASVILIAHAVFDI